MRLPDPSTTAVDEPQRLLLVMAVLLLLCGIGAGELTFDPRYGTFFADDDPQLLDFEHLRGVFAPSDAVAFVVELPEGAPTGDVFSGAGAEAVSALTAGGWQLPYALRVDAWENFPHAWTFCEDETDEQCDAVEIAPLRDYADSSAPTAAARSAQLRELVLSTPELAGRLVDASGDHAMVVVTVLPKGDPLASTQRLVEAARALAARVEAAHAGLRVHVGGIVAMNHAFSESSLLDSARLLPVMFALMFVGLGWLLGGWRPMAAVVVVIVAANAATLGLAGWAGLVLTTPTAIAPIVIATVAVADCVHVVLGQYGPGVVGDGRARLLASLEENRTPVLLTSVTTAAGFASMNFSAVPPFRDLGNLVAVGALAAGALSLTLLPALLRLIGGQARPARLPRERIAALAEAVLRRRTALLVLCLGVLAILLPGLARLSVNDDFVAYFDDSLPFRRAAELTDAHLGGMYEIEYQLVAVDGSAHDTAFLAEVADFTRWLREQPETGHVLSWTDVLARIGRAMEPARGGALPADAAAASQYTLLYELSLPLGQDLTNMIAPDHGSVRQLVSLRGVDSRTVIAFEARAERWLADHAPSISERHGGINLMFAHISERNVEAMFEGNLLAVVVIAFVLALALRSLRLAAVSLVTNLVPVIAAFGAWGWFSGNLGLAISTCFGMTLGIVVDDTVHLLARYRRRRLAGASSQDAVRAALVGVGPALVVTSVILAVGFAVLATSTFAINASLARMTLLTVLLALLFDLLALPALLAGLRGGPSGNDATGTAVADDRPAERS